MKMSKKILSEDTRERLVQAYENTKDVSEVALMFNVSESTVFRLVGQKRKTGSLALQTSKRGRKSSLTPEMLTSIEDKLHSQPDITLQEMIEELKLPIKVSELCNIIIHKLGFTRKKK